MAPKKTVLEKFSHNIPCFQANKHRFRFAWRKRPFCPLCRTLASCGNFVGPVARSFCFPASGLDAPCREVPAENFEHLCLVNLSTPAERPAFPSTSYGQVLALDCSKYDYPPFRFKVIPSYDNLPRGATEKCLIFLTFVVRTKKRPRRFAIVTPHTWLEARCYRPGDFSHTAAEVMPLPARCTTTDENGTCEVLRCRLRPTAQPPNQVPLRSFPGRLSWASLRSGKRPLKW